MLRSALIFISVCLPGVTSAQCLTANTGAGCSSARVIVKPPSREEIIAQTPSPIEIGTYLRRGEYSIVMNAPYYGLPPARDGWVYYRIEDDVFRVDYNTLEVLERATAETSANWPP